MLFSRYGFFRSITKNETTWCLVKGTSKKKNDENDHRYFGLNCKYNKIKDRLVNRL